MSKKAPKLVDVLDFRLPPGSKPFSTNKELAAVYLAMGEPASKVEICRLININLNTLHRWTEEPDFAYRVEEYRQAIRASILSIGISIKESRVKALNDRWLSLKAIVKARAQDPNYQSIPGYSTGLMVHTRKVIGTGQNAQTLDEYYVDAPLLKEMRAHEEQAAKELGQWSEKVDMTHHMDLSTLSDADLLTLKDITRRARDRPALPPAQSANQTVDAVEVKVLPTDG